MIQIIEAIGRYVYMEDFFNCHSMYFISEKSAIFILQLTKMFKVHLDLASLIPHLLTSENTIKKTSVFG